MLSRENELSPPKICKFRKKVNLKKTLCRENDETFSPFQRSKNHFSRLNHQIQSPQIPSYSLHSSSLLLHPLAGALSEFISISSFTSSTVKQWRTHQPLAEYQRFCLIHPRTPLRCPGRCGSGHRSQGDGKSLHVSFLSLRTLICTLFSCMFARTVRDSPLVLA